MTPAELAAQALEAVWRAVDAGEAAVLVDSPPGAGKSTLVREVGRRAARRTQVPIVAQTNEQADDMVRGLLRDKASGLGTGLVVGRLHAATYSPPDDLARDPSVVLSGDIGRFTDVDLVVSTARKWAHVGTGRWPFGIIDEAYQMRSDDLIPVGAMVDRLLLVGDPGQLSPFTAADDTHLRGLPMSPLHTAAGVIATTHPQAPQIALPVSWRLSPSAAAVVSDAFYATPFAAGTGEGVRSLRLPLAAVSTPEQAALRIAADGGWAVRELPDMLMPSNDPQAVQALADLVREALTSPPDVVDEHGERALLPADIAVGVTHRDQRARVRFAVDAVCQELDLPAGSVTVDTANRLQGRQYELVFAWHPLSGRRDATAFHLEAGRLCVLLSRHRQACVVVTRAGLRRQLEAHPSTDPIWVGERLPVVDGWSAHLALLDHLEPLRVAAA